MPWFESTIPSQTGAGYPAPFHISEETLRIIGAATQVHKELGPGYEEVIYPRDLASELQARGLDFSREVWIDVLYRGKIVGKIRVDFKLDGIMVEI